MRNAACDAINQGVIFLGQIRMEHRCFLVIQRHDLELRCSAPIQRAFFAQNLTFHKTHGRATQDQVHLGLCPFMVDDVLKHCGNSGFSLCKIRILINYKYDPLLLGESCQFVQCCIVGCKFRRWFCIGSFKTHDCLGQGFQIFFSGRIQGREENGRFILAEFIDQRSFSNTASAVNDNAFKLSILISFV